MDCYPNFTTGKVVLFGVKSFEFPQKKLLISSKMKVVFEMPRGKAVFLKGYLFVVYDDFLTTIQTLLTRQTEPP